MNRADNEKEPSFVSYVSCGGDNLDMTSLIWVIKLTFDKKYVLRP